MTRQSYNPSKLDTLKVKRSAYTVKQNNSIEPYKHAALVISRKGDGAIIGYGTNNYKRYGSEHAEECAFKRATRYLKINKSRNLNNYKSRMKVDLIVIRTTGNNSKPCYNCITDHIVNNKYFNIKKIMYSDNDVNGGYIYTNKNKLFDTREEHYSGFNATRLGINKKINNLESHINIDNIDNISKNISINNDLIPNTNHNNIETISNCCNCCNNNNNTEICNEEEGEDEDGKEKPLHSKHLLY